MSVLLVGWLSAIIKRLLSGGGFMLTLLFAIILQYRVPVPEVFFNQSSVVRAAVGFEPRDVGITSDNELLPRLIRNRLVRSTNPEPDKPIGRFALLEADDNPESLAKRRENTPGIEGLNPSVVSHSIERAFAK